MARRPAASTAAIRFDVVDDLETVATIGAAVAGLGGRIRTLATVRRIDDDPPLCEAPLLLWGWNSRRSMAAHSAAICGAGTGGGSASSRANCS